jgi:hypothetical protein
MSYVLEPGAEAEEDAKVDFKTSDHVPIKMN